MTPLLGAIVMWGACPVLTAEPGGVGETEAVRSPSAAAVRLNQQGRDLYRQGRWEQARAKYRAALAADPRFLGPALNVACSFSRQERYAEAAAEAVSLIRRAFIPWGREILEAADLAPLHVRPEMTLLRDALAETAREWGESTRGALFFVARTQPALRRQGEGVMVLGVHQEIFAWLPRTGRYRQITAEGGSVLAFAQSMDGRRLVFVRGGKLLRLPGGGAPAALRGLSIRVLELSSMSLGRPFALDGDVTSVNIATSGASGASVEVERSDGKQTTYRLMDETFEPVLAAGNAVAGRGSGVHLTATGVIHPTKVRVAGDCAFSAENATDPAKPPRIRIRGGDRPIDLQAPHGAGLFGLPF